MPEQKAALEEELRQAEESYGEKMREAEANPDPVERRSRLENLKNSFGTRQSGIRRKYGVRLRERRTRAEIEAERVRMLGGNGESGSQSQNQAGDSPMMPPSQGGNGGKRGMSEGADVGDAAGANATGGSSSSGHEVKRSRLMGPVGMGSGHRATQYDSDEMADRMRKSPSLPNSYTPSKMASAALAMQKATTTSSMHMSSTYPVELSDSSSDNEDIPARLPAAVRQSLDQ